MNIGIPLKELGEIDTSALKDVILRAEEKDWLDNSYRQQVYDVHTQTHSLVMLFTTCLLYTSPSPRDRQKSRMPSSA